MNKWLFLVLIFNGLPVEVQAMPHAGESTEHRRLHLAHLTEKLSLSEAQQQEISALWDRQHERFAEIRTETETGMQEILNPEQYAKLHSCKREGGKHGHHAQGSQ